MSEWPVKIDGQRHFRHFLCIAPRTDMFQPEYIYMQDFEAMLCAPCQQIFRKFSSVSPHPPPSDILNAMYNNHVMPLTWISMFSLNFLIHVQKVQQFLTVLLDLFAVSADLILTDVFYGSATHSLNRSLSDFDSQSIKPFNALFYNSCTLQSIWHSSS